MLFWPASASNTPVPAACGALSSKPHDLDVCEGASEVGLLRGLDLHRVTGGEESLNAHGVALVDAGGVTKIYARANALAMLDYRIAVLRDDDVQPDAGEEGTFDLMGGDVFKWQLGQALEQALFTGVSDNAVHLLLERAVDIHGEELIAAHVDAASFGTMSLADCRGPVTDHVRTTLADAAKSKKNSWFKTVGWMEEVARDIIGPDLADARPEFRATLEAVFTWCANA